MAMPLMTTVRGAFVCTVAGVPTEIEAAEIAHGVNQPVGTATVTFAAPLPAHVTRNAVIEVQAGFLETGGLVRRFIGRIVSRKATLALDGKTAQVQCVGRASLLAFPDQRDLIYYNSSSLRGIFRSLCQRREVPAYHADYVRDPIAGTIDIRLGGNPLVDGGNVIIKRLTSPLDWLVQKARLFGYRVFDTPSGVLTMQRVSGVPSTYAVQHAEGIDLLEATGDDTLEGYVTYWEVKGASYTDADGINVAIRSFPATVPYSAELDPPGYRSDRVSDDSLVNQQLADWVRNVLEIDYLTPQYTETYRINPDTSLQPGMPIYITSATLGGLSGYRWIMGIRETVSKAGYEMTLDVWRGGTTALPAGNDATTITVGTGPVHLGDEVVPWYAQPSPAGHVYRFPITVPDDYTAMVLTFKAHGCNSYLLDGANSDATVSKIEVWQGATDKPVGSSNLPVLNEDYSQQRDYTSLANWTDVRLPVPGQVTAGRAEVRITSGEDSRLPDSTKWDDFEVRDIALTLTGVGTPVLPGEQL